MGSLEAGDSNGRWSSKSTPGLSLNFTGAVQSAEITIGAEFGTLGSFCKVQTQVQGSFTSLVLWELQDSLGWEATNGRPLSWLAIPFTCNKVGTGRKDSSHEYMPRSNASMQTGQTGNPPKQIQHSGLCGLLGGQVSGLYSPAAPQRRWTTFCLASHCLSKCAMFVHPIMLL